MGGVPVRFSESKAETRSPSTVHCDLVRASLQAFSLPHPLSAFPRSPSPWPTAQTSSYTALSRTAASPWHSLVTCRVPLSTPPAFLRVLGGFLSSPSIVWAHVRLNVIGFRLRRALTCSLQQTKSPGSPCWSTFFAYSHLLLTTLASSSSRHGRWTVPTTAAPQCSMTINPSLTKTVYVSHTFCAPQTQRSHTFCQPGSVGLGVHRSSYNRVSSRPVPPLWVSATQLALL